MPDDKAMADPMSIGPDAADLAEFDTEQFEQSEAIDWIIKGLNELRMQIHCIDGYTKPSQRQVNLLAGINNLNKWVCHLESAPHYNDCCHCVEPNWIKPVDNVFCSHCDGQPVHGQKAKVKDKVAV